MERYFKGQFAARGIRWPGVWITSGYRTQAHQAAINPDVPNSLHTRCPSLAVDLRVGSVAGIDSPELLAMLGGWWRLRGLRWGGMFEVPDPIHFDMGRVIL